MFISTDIHGRGYAGEFKAEWYVEVNNGSPPYVVLRLEGLHTRAVLFLDREQLAQVHRAAGDSLDALVAKIIDPAGTLDADLRDTVSA